MSLGAGYTKGDITVDAAFMYLKFMERKVDSTVQDDALADDYLNGTYNSTAMLPGVTVSYKF